MKIGYMNSPYRSLKEEMEFSAKHGFDVFELTIEPPHAAVDNINTDSVRLLLAKHKLKVVGHTAWYIPYASHIPEVREVSRAHLKKYFMILRAVGAKMVTVHTNFIYPSIMIESTIKHHIICLQQICNVASEYNLTVLLEPLGDNDITTIKGIIKKVPMLGMTLDLGHAHIGEGIHKYISHFDPRIMHVHASDNKGKYDQHLPIGAGRIDFYDSLSALKKIDYNSTITTSRYATG